MNKSPDQFAYAINRVIQAAFGNAAYPLDMRDIVSEFAPKYAPGVALNLSSGSLGSIEGALIPSSSKKSYTILINSDIRSRGRRNFTIAHEFGHFLCHRSLRDEFQCGPDQVGGASTDDIETQANRFASQLLLPNNMVRETANRTDFCLEAVRELARQTGASVTATALACVKMSSQPIGFVVVRDGFVRWGRSSEKAYAAGLFFKSGSMVPSDSASDFEGGDEDLTFESPTKVEGWSTSHAWKESGFYSARYQEAYFLLTA